MNTHDIELPPLPEWLQEQDWDTKYPVSTMTTAMNQYARAAIETDRKRRGEPVAWRVYPFDYGVGFDGVYALTNRPDQAAAWERKGWEVQPLYTAPQPAEPDYKQLFEQICERCDALDAKLAEYSEREPVGYIMPSAIKQLKAGGNAIVGGVSQGFDVPIYTAPQPAEPVSQHPDDAAVDAFAVIMKAKLKRARDEKGRGGWQDMSAAELSAMLREHVEKGDPVDVANLAMMLSLNGQRIVPAEPVKVPSDADIDELSREWGLLSAAYPSKSMVRDFARALLARYGGGTP